MPALNPNKEMDKYQTALSLYNLEIKDDDVNNAVKKILEKAGDNNTREVKELLINCMEITSLSVTDNEESILRLTENVNALALTLPELPSPAAICVYPRFAGIVSESLEVSKTKIACVSGGFPSAQSLIEVKTVETALAVNDGANEIDMVMPVGAFLNDDYGTVYEEISEIKMAAGEAKLKVILETGALQTASNIKRAAIISMYSGADYIKTSTGKIEPAATPEAAYVICQTIKEYFQKTGIMIGFKAAGGIKTIKEAIDYYTIAKELLGEKWLNNEYFRIGTSQLINLAISELTGKEFKKF